MGTAIQILTDYSNDGQVVVHGDQYSDQRAGFLHACCSDSGLHFRDELRGVVERRSATSR